MPGSPPPRPVSPAASAEPGPAPGAEPEAAGARVTMAEHAERLRGRLAEVVAERDALVAERHAVLGVLDRLRAALTAAGPAQSEVLLTDRATLPTGTGAVEVGDMLPVVVAGTGRSGTTTTAMLLDGHADVAAAEVELRFHTSLRRGLPGLLAGALTPDDFVGHMRSHWYRRPRADVRLREAGVGDAGLYRFMSPEELEAALADFTATWPSSPERACRNLFEAPIRAATAGRTPRAWVEHSPANLQVADMLHGFLPDMRLVHVVRDGRDVARSLLRRNWGVADLVDGIRWWGHRMLRGHRRTRGLPQVLHVRFERLGVTHRQETLAALLDFLDLEADDGIQERFAARVDPDRVNRGRWQQDVPPAGAAEVDAAYRGVLERLRRHDVPVEGLLEDVPDLGDDALERELLRQEVYELRIENRLLLDENLQLGAIAAAGELGGGREQVLADLRRALRHAGAGE